nr:hypothetical protein [Tanacetum cinerariifolium]
MAPDESFSSKNYVRKFVRTLHPKWKEKVIAIEESKDLSSLSLDELIGNLKVYEVTMEKDSKIVKGKREKMKSLAVKSKKESSDDETSTSRREDEEYTMAVRVFKNSLEGDANFLDNRVMRRDNSKETRMIRKGKMKGNALDVEIQDHLIEECLKPPRINNQKALLEDHGAIAMRKMVKR